MKLKMVKRKISDLKPDPDQPRKKFDEEVIQNLANTFKTQGVINPIEIDENNIIITGEMRWRASKITYPDNKEINCKLITEITPEKRFERQTIENLHHNYLSEPEEREAIIRLWNSGKYDTYSKLGYKIGRSGKHISNSLRMVDIEKNIGVKKLVQLGKKKALIIDSAVKDIVEQKKVIEKSVQENLRQEEVRELVKEIKTMPKEIKEKILEPQSKITIKQAKEIKKLPPKVIKGVLKEKITVEEAKIVSQMPEDVKKEVLKTKSEITVEDAKLISEFSEPEQRKKITAQIKEAKQTTKKIIKEEYDIDKGKKEAPVIAVIDIDQKIIDKMQEIYFQITREYRDENLKEYGAKTQDKCIEIMRKAYQFIYKECEKYGKRYIQ